MILMSTEHHSHSSDRSVPYRRAESTSSRFQNHGDLHSISLARRLSQYSVKPFEIFGPLLFSLVIFVVIVIGWVNRSEGYLTAEEGLGYFLGIFGSVLMLLLLLYPLRKRWKAMRRIGSVSFWFRWHMIFGVVGPVLILFHANFATGSTNSTIALISMLIVAASGVVGRFIYRRIHMGLYGKKAQIQEIVSDAEIFKFVAGDDLQIRDLLEKELIIFEQDVVELRKGFLSSFWLLLTLTTKIRKCKKGLLKTVRKTVASQAKRNNWKTRDKRHKINVFQSLLDPYFMAVRKATLFNFYERLFKLWHVLHLPLFFFLILAAIAHIVAVHLY